VTSEDDDEDEEETKSEKKKKRKGKRKRSISKRRKSRKRFGSGDDNDESDGDDEITSLSPIQVKELQIKQFTQSLNKKKSYFMDLETKIEPICELDEEQFATNEDVAPNFKSQESRLAQTKGVTEQRRQSVLKTTPIKIPDEKNAKKNDSEDSDDMADKGKPRKRKGKQNDSDDKSSEDEGIKSESEGKTSDNEEEEDEEESDSDEDNDDDEDQDDEEGEDEEESEEEDVFLTKERTYIQPTDPELKTLK